jgi:hypothetical protein
MGLSDMDWALDQFRDAGLNDVRGEAVEITMRHPEGNDAMASLGTRIGPARRVINHFSATADDIAAIESAIKSELAPYGDAGVPATLHLLSARKG